MVVRALIFALIAGFVAAPLSARAVESHVWVKNVTDKWVWVTAIGTKCNTYHNPGLGGLKNLTTCGNGHIVHEWCVPPGNVTGDVNKQGFHLPLNEVHLLVTAHQNCGRPILRDWTLNAASNWAVYIVKYTVFMRTINGVKTYDVEKVH